MTVGAIRKDLQESYEAQLRSTSRPPQKRAKPKVSTSEAAAAAAAPSTPRAKQTRTSTAAAPLAPLAEEEASNSTQGGAIGSDAQRASPPVGEAGISQESYVALQQELADLRREMAIL